MNRRRFLRWAWTAPLALAWGAAAALQGCGSGDTTAYPSGGSSPASCDGATPSSMTSVGHTHPLCVTQAQLLAAADGTVVTLEDGGAGHTHTITLNGTDLTNIDGGVSVGPVTSTLTGHTHDVFFN